MLETLHKFKSSLNPEQEALLRASLPQEIIQRFFSANDENSAGSIVEEMNEYLTSKPLVALALYKKLSSEQRTMISDMVFND